MPAFLRTLEIVVGQRLNLDFLISPLILTKPQSGFSLFIRIINPLSSKQTPTVYTLPDVAIFEDGEEDPLISLRPFYIRILFEECTAWYTDVEKIPKLSFEEFLEWFEFEESQITDLEPFQTGL